MQTIRLTRSSAGTNGFGTDLPLERDFGAVTVDARALGAIHPMFVLRLRMFIDWQIAAGGEVQVVPPEEPTVAQALVDMGLGHGVDPANFAQALPTPRARPEIFLPVRAITNHHDVEDATKEAVTLIEAQSKQLSTWGDATYMTLSELGDNAIEHGGANWAYVAADRVDGDQRAFRLAVADLGMGIPEHVRARYPEWQDDVAAIARVLQRGVTGTGDPHRGNGYAEILEKSTSDHLVRANSAASLDIRSARGQVTVDLFGGVVNVTGNAAYPPRRGTWVTYSVVTV